MLIIIDSDIQIFFRQWL